MIGVGAPCSLAQPGEVIHTESGFGGFTAHGPWTNQKVPGDFFIKSAQSVNAMNLALLFGSKIRNLAVHKTSCWGIDKLVSQQILILSFAGSSPATPSK